jgi:hypothetical protein
MPRYVFDIIIRTVDSVVIKAEGITDARKQLDTLIEQRHGRELVDFEVVRCDHGTVAAPIERTDLAEAARILNINKKLVIICLKKGLLRGLQYGPFKYQIIKKDAELLKSALNERKGQ